MNELYTCPKCGELLTRDGNSLTCPSRHTYDLARSGYVNLLLAEQMNTKLPGDNKLMVNARKSFLDKGYYANLLTALCDTVLRYIEPDASIFDAGCGEGYYTAGIARRLTEEKIPYFIAGTDISKTAVDAAAKRFRANGLDKNAFLSVSSVFHLPVKSGSCKLMTTLFAPFCESEYRRILADDGKMIMVIPSERHLFGLKQAVYDKPYLNEVKSFELDKFGLLEHIHIEDTITLNTNEDILNLFSMTPYYYKTSAEDQARLNKLNTLTTETGFEILVYGAKA